MKLPEAPDAWFNRQIKRHNGIFDKPSFDLMMAACKKFDTAIDVGAHVGTWSLGLAKKFKHVYAIEPEPTNHSFLMKNLINSGLKNIYPDFIAFGHIEKTVHMECGQTNSGENHISDNPNGFQTQMYRLDDWLDAQLFHSHRPFMSESIDLIKIDVEGYELFVLQGAEKTIDEFKPVLSVELCHSEAYGHSTAEIKDWILSKGYKLIGVSNKDYVFRV